MVRKGSVTFDGFDKLATHMEEHDRKVKRVVLGHFLRASDEATAYAKTNAPWTDRTGNARAGLHSSVDIQPNSFELIVAGSVFYQIFLETRFSGRYAIILPTVNHIGGILMQRIQASLNQMEAA